MSEIYTPQNIGLEMTILGAMMDNNKNIPFVVSILGGSEEGADHFCAVTHRIIYKVVVTLYEEGKKAHITTILSRLGDETARQIGGGEYLVECIDFFDGNFDKSLLDELKKFNQARKILATTINIKNNVNNLKEEGGSIDKFVEDSTKAMQMVMLADVNKIRSIKTIAKEVFDSWNERMDTGGLLGLESHIPKLNRMTGGYVGGRVYVLGGRPGMGKTSLALEEVDHQIKQSKRAGVVTLEMSDEELVSRIIAQRAGLNYSLLQNDPKTFREKSNWPLASRAFAELIESKLVIIDIPGADIFKICASIENAHYEEPLELVVIDYLQLIGGIDPKHMVTGISQAMVEIKALARKLNIPIIVVSQLSRDVEKRGKNKRPVASDLRESGGIEQTADFILFVYRESVYNPDAFPTIKIEKKPEETESEKARRIELEKEQRIMEKAKQISELICAKNRQGPMGTIYTFFHGPSTHFYQDDFMLATVVQSNKYAPLTEEDLMTYGVVDSKGNILVKPVIDEDKDLTPLPGDKVDRKSGYKKGQPKKKSDGDKELEDDKDDYNY